MFFVDAAENGSFEVLLFTTVSPYNLKILNGVRFSLFVSVPRAAFGNLKQRPDSEYLIPLYEPELAR